MTTTTSHHPSIKKYLAVFGALLILTGATVGVSYLHIGSIVITVGIALLIAAAKGSLVAAFFMHLMGEHKWIYLVLALTAFFFLVMLLVPFISHFNDYRI